MTSLQSEMTKRICNLELKLKKAIKLDAGKKEDRPLVNYRTQKIKISPLLKEPDQ